MEMAPTHGRQIAEGSPMARTGGVARGSALLARTGRSRFDRERYAHVLARHDAMGAVPDAFRAAHRLHFQPAAFFTATEPAFLGPPGFVSQPWRLLIEFGHADHPLCLSAIFPGG